MTRRRWIALGVLVVIGIGLLVAVVVVPWGDDSSTTAVYHEGDDITVAVVTYQSKTDVPMIGPLVPDPWLHVRVTMRAERPR
jgi:hypothetical protein